MKVDFWQLSRDPVEKVVAMIAQRVLDSDERLLVVSGEQAQREAISRELWKAGPESFLANGVTSTKGAERSTRGSAPHLSQRVRHRLPCSSITV